ncbi:MAG: type II toxin-antitoxin system HicB family antitoxin [Chloroflexi bacterium]|nr:type II toxin-antitoxin system HicB family antitoxin [Chloroflexota bacterium]
MIFRVGIENNNEGIRSIAWALEHPGCFAYGKDEKEALANLPEAIHAYVNWIGQHESPWKIDAAKIELKVEDVFTAYCVDKNFERVENSDNEINAWFQHDWKPLTAADIERGLKLLAWTREDLLETIKGLSAEKLEMTYDGERWPINGILNHVGGADWWYMDRLGLAFPRHEVPKEPLARLEKVRAHLNQTLPKLEGVKQVVGTDGEIWSPRKMLRRAVWHEKDHIIHIRKLI